MILCTGDIGSSDFARQLAFKNFDRRRKGLEEKEYTNKQSKKVFMEIYNSTLIIKKISSIAPVYSILGNIGTSMVRDSWVKEESKKLKLKLPSYKQAILKVKNFYFIKNRVRKINGLRIGFLEYFIDNSWIKEFEEKDESFVNNAKKMTPKTKKILQNFGKVDLLVCHQPPYGILDKVNNSSAPKEWEGKHAGSKVILDYIRKYQPKYVFCGHIHEAKGKKKIGKTIVYNVGCCGDYVLLDIK